MKRVLTVSVLVSALCTLQSPTFAQVEHESTSPNHIQNRESWFYKGRRAPDGKSGAPLLQEGFRAKQRMREAAAAGGPSALSTTQAIISGSWTPVGPVPINSNAAGASDDYDYGPVAGRVTSIVVDQADTTGNTVYVGTANGGIWKSTNARNATASAVKWTPLTDQQPSLAIGSIAIQPGNRNLIVAGTGEANFSADSYYAQGILRSTDAGATWATITSGKQNGYSVSFLGISMGAVAFSVDNPDLVVMGAGYDSKGAVNGVDSTFDSRFGIWYSLDAGVHWVQATIRDPSGVTGWSVNSIVYNPVEHAFFAVVGFHGVYKSTNGWTWTRLPTQPGTMLTTTNCPLTTSSSCPIGRGALTVRPGADEMYIWYVNNQEKDQGIYKTVDGGKSWQSFTISGIESCGDTAGCGTSQGAYNLVLSAVPNGAGTDLYAGAINIFKCSVSGSNPTCAVHPFVNLTHVYGCSPVGSTSHVHPDQHALDFSVSSPSVMYFGNDGGVYRTLKGFSLTNGTCSGTNAFDDLNTTLGSLTQFIHISGHPSDPTTLLGGTQDNGSPATDSSHSTATGTYWTAVNGGDGGFNEINRRSPLEWFTSHPGIYIARCTAGINCQDGTFTTIVTNKSLANDVSEFYPPFLLDPGKNGVMYAGTCRLWRGPTTTATGWAAVSPLLFTSSSSYCDASTTSAITAIAVGGSVGTKGSQAAWLGYDNGTLRFKFGLDGTGGWYENYFGYAPVSSIVLDPTDPTGHTAYATFLGFVSAHVAKMRGASGGSIQGNLPDVPVNSIAPDPENSNILYVGTDVGVYYTQDGGTIWSEVAPGSMPNAVVTHVRIYEYNKVKKLRAATYGRGVWSVDLVWNNPPQGGFGSAVSKGVANQVSQGEHIVFSGWAADDEDGAPVASVRVLMDGKKIGDATLGLKRSDIATSFGRPDWLYSGWTLDYPMSAWETPGTHTITVKAFDKPGVSSTLGSKTITVLANQLPTGTVGALMNAVDHSTTIKQNGTLLITGWAADNEDGAPVKNVDVTLSPSYYGFGASKMGIARPDIVTKTGHSDWLYSGWQTQWDLSKAPFTFTPGTYTANGMAEDITTGHWGNLNGHPTITVVASPIIQFGGSFDFGTHGMHDWAQTTLYAFNNGALAAHITSLTMSGPFTQTNTCSSLIPAGGQCIFTVTFTPVAIGPVSGSISLLTDDGLAAHVLNFTANVVADALQLTPDPINFGTVRVGHASGEHTLTIKNITTHVVGLISDRIDVNVVDAATTCAFPSSLAAGVSCTVGLRYTPTFIGLNTEAITFTTDQPDSPRTVYLNVTGTGGEIGTSADPLQLPDTAIGQSSKATETITNIGNADLHITSVTTNAPFSVTSDCATVTPGATCSVVVQFTPAVSGTTWSTVTIQSDDVRGSNIVFGVSGYSP